MSNLRQYYRALNRIYTATPAMYGRDHGWDGFKWLNVDDRERSSVAFMRMEPDAEKGAYLVCACNFTPVRYDDFQIGLPLGRYA